MVSEKLLRGAESNTYSILVS